MCIQSKNACSKWFLVRQSCMIFWIITWVWYESCRDVSLSVEYEKFLRYFSSDIPWKIKFTGWNCRGSIIQYSRDHCTCSAAGPVYIPGDRNASLTSLWLTIIGGSGKPAHAGLEVGQREGRLRDLIRNHTANVISISWEGYVTLWLNFIAGNLYICQLSQRVQIWNAHTFHSAWQHLENVG